MRREWPSWSFARLMMLGLGVSLGVCLVMLVAGIVLAQQGDEAPHDGYDLSWWTVDGGGGSFSSGPGYSLGGRSPAGCRGAERAGYTLAGGFCRAGGTFTASTCHWLYAAIRIVVSRRYPPAGDSMFISACPRDYDLAVGAVIDDVGFRLAYLRCRTCCCLR